MSSNSPSTFALWDRQWLHTLLKPIFRRLALLVFVGSFFFPTAGLGVDLCPLHALTGLPCGGCGVTRGLAMMSQGELAMALGANPFVIIFWPLLVLLALSAALPQHMVSSMETRLAAIEPTTSWLGKILVAAFLGFGVLRFFTFLLLGEHFP